MYQRNGVIICFLSGLFFLIGLLFFEYYSLVCHRRQLQELKDEYRVYVYEVRKILTDYYTTKERLAQIEGVSKSDEMYTSLLFATDTEDDQQEALVPINRDLEYLKQQSQAYINRNDLHQLFKHASEDIWLDYTDIALIEKKQKVTRPKKRLTKKQTKRSITSTSGIKKERRSELFSWPIKRSDFWISSLYGRRRNANGAWGFHKAIDMAALKGTPVIAAASGVVIEVQNIPRGYGKTIVIQHNNKYKTRYAHLNAIYVKVGQKVERGMRIGDVGDTGFVRKSGKDASHLHFELSIFGERVNPLYYLA